MDTAITTIAALIPAAGDGRAPQGARHSGADQAFGSALDGALDSTTEERRAVSPAPPRRAATTPRPSAPPRRHAAAAAGPDQHNATGTAEGSPDGPADASRPARTRPTEKTTTGGPTSQDASRADTEASIEVAPTDDVPAAVVSRQRVAVGDADASEPASLEPSIQPGTELAAPVVALAIDATAVSQPQMAWAAATPTFETEGAAVNRTGLTDQGVAPVGVSPSVPTPSAELFGAQPADRIGAGGEQTNLTIPGWATSVPLSGGAAAITEQAPAVGPQGHQSVRPLLARPIAIGTFGPVAASDQGATPIATVPQRVPTLPVQSDDSSGSAALLRGALARVSAASTVNGDLQAASRTIAAQRPGLVMPPIAETVSAGVADAQVPETSPAAVAARAPFQFAADQSLEPMAWARAELAKTIQVTGDGGSTERVIRMPAGMAGQGSSAGGGQQGFNRPDADPSAAAFAGSGFPSSGISGGQTSSFESSSVRSSGTTAEPQTDSGPLSASVVRVVRLKATEGGGEMQLRLRPDHLGELTVSVKVQAGMVSATLQSDSAEVRAWIQQHQQDLRSGLREQGLILDQLTVDPEGRQQQRQNPQQEPERAMTGRRQAQGQRFEALL